MKQKRSEISEKSIGKKKRKKEEGRGGMKKQRIKLQEQCT
jgi:hypothetical protein